MNGGEVKVNGTESNDLSAKVFYALQALHNPSTDRDSHARADLFLSKEFPKMPECWDVLDQYLTKPEIPAEGHFFAANTLRRKIAFNFNTIPKEKHQMFKTRLIEHLDRFGAMNDPSRWNVIVQLAVAIATAAIHMPEWNTVVDDILNSMGRPETMVAMLQVLKMLPEELNNTSIPVAQHVRRQLRTKLKANAAKILEVCESLFASAQSRVLLQKRVLECFSSWVFYMDVIEPDKILKSSLFKVPFEALHSTENEFLSASDLFEISTQCLNGYVRICSRGLREAELANNQPLHKGWQVMMEQVVPGVVGLGVPFQKAMQQEDETALKGFARVFVELGLRFQDWLLGGSAESNKLIEFLLQCTACKSLDVSWTTFEFWGDAAEMQIRHQAHNNEQLQPESSPAHQMFKALIPKMIDVMQLPLDWEETHKDDQADIKHHRDDGVHILMDVCVIVGSDVFLNQITEVLDVHQKANSWQGVESCIFVLSRCTVGMHDVIEKRKAVNDKMNHLLTLLPSLNDHLRVKEVSCSLLSFNAWRYRASPDMIKSVLEFLVKCFGEPKIALEATQALSKVCDICEETMIPFTEELMTLYYKQSINLDVDSQVNIIKALSSVISRMQNAEEAQSYFLKLLQFPFSHVQETLKNAGDMQNAMPDAVATSLYHAMKRLAEVFKYCNPRIFRQARPHPVIQALEKSWNEFLKGLIMTQVKNEELMEKCTKCIKCGIRTAPEQFMESSLATDCLNMMTEQYMKEPLSCFLYICTIYVDEYGEQEKAHDTLTSIFKCLSQKTIPMLSSVQCFDNNPDCVEDYFELLVKYHKRCPKILMQPDHILPVFECGLNGLGLQHRDAGEAVLKFFIETVKQTQENPKAPPNPNLAQYREIVTRLLEPKGNFLLLKMLESVMEGRSRDGQRWMMRYLYQLFEVLFKFNAQSLKNNMTYGLQNLKYENNIINPEYPTKDEFIRDYFNARNDGERREAISAFMYSCDRYRATLL